MHGKKSQVPPMHTLTALESFARVGSVWQAAEELGVTRSAISHRLGILEEVLGFDVVKRSGKGITLTARGKRYVQDVRKSLELLAGAQDEGSSAPVDGVLRVSSTPGFASMWLCNHIASLYAEHPGLNIEITTGRDLAEVSVTDMDLFIVFGDGYWPRHAIRHLYDVEFQPMCSPALLSMQGGLNRAADALHFPLLHLRQWDDWIQWLAANGVAFPKRNVGITFSDMMLVQRAAIAGQGIMMGDEVTCAAALASGQLVSPFSVKIKLPGGYYLARDRRKRVSPAILAFTRWLDALIARILAELRDGRSSP
jgi:LysR family transcriptional regulator, glycine cleavage system transcriptional activator